MKTHKLTKSILVVVAMAALTVLNTGSALAQVSEEVLNSITTPDKVETSIGTLNFIDGSPMPETAEKLHDYLDTMRGVDAFMKGIPGASIQALLEGMDSIGTKEAHQIPIWEDMGDPGILGLTWNATTMYIMPSIHLDRDGPIVAEMPAGLLGVFQDAWFGYVGDVGPLGPDKGKGGKYLFLPPGYEGEVPEGYHVMQSPTYAMWWLIRASIKGGIQETAARVKAQMKVYPLSMVDNPPKMEFINGTGRNFNTVHANDFEFYEEINSVIQREPLESLNKETRGLFASIGIEKGKPFKPDARMRRILTDAVAIGNATIRATVWYPRLDKTMKGIKVYPDDPNSNYVLGWLEKNVFFDGKDHQTMNTDARAFFHYFATGVTPAMAVEIPGKGSDYAAAFVDSKSMPFDGEKTYKMHIPAKVPTENFWSVTLYDSQTRSEMRSDQPFPSVDNIQNKFRENTDGSIDIYFAPTPPIGYEQNWLQTIPGKSWFTIFRNYSPGQAFLDRTWRVGEVEQADGVALGEAIPPLNRKWKKGPSNMRPDTLEHIQTPDVVETSIGTLKFIDGAPMPENNSKVYDYLDTMRAADAFLKGIPGASLTMLLQGLESIGTEEAHQVVIMEGLLGSKPFFLTANTSTLYVVPTLNLDRDGPTVLELPPGQLGAFNDHWFRHLADIGPFGPGKGEGGKFLVLPPGYDGEVPEGYYVVKSPTYGVWVVVRASVKAGLEVVTKQLKESIKVYPLSKADNPPKMEFINGADKAYNTVHANDFKFLEELNGIIQREPLGFLDKETRGLFASIGIEKGKEFNPDARMKKLLTDGVAIGNGIARANLWFPRREGTLSGAFVYPDDPKSSWQRVYPFADTYFDGPDNHTMNTDARAFYHYHCTVVTPAMALSLAGKGSEYITSFSDQNKHPFDGAKTYKLRVPANAPASRFWSATVYDSQTRSELQNGQKFPAVDSIQNKFRENADGSVDVYFAPEAPKGYEENWVKTLPGKSWFVMFRLYGPEQAWIDRSWKLPEIEQAK